VIADHHIDGILSERDIVRVIGERGAAAHPKNTNSATRFRQSSLLLFWVFERKRFQRKKFHLFPRLQVELLDTLGFSIVQLHYQLSVRPQAPEAVKRHVTAVPAASNQRMGSRP
jgi:hypothetical protein